MPQEFWPDPLANGDIPKWKTRNPKPEYVTGVNFVKRVRIFVYKTIMVL